MTIDLPLSMPPTSATLLLVAVLTTLACDQPPPPIADDEAESEDEDESGTPGESESESESESSGEHPDETDESTGGDDTIDLEDSLYPLIDGARWTYVVTNTFGQITDTQVIDARETTWKGAQAWELVDKPDVEGDWDVSTIVRDGDLTLRVHREEMGSFGTTEILDYEPGFARASEAWVTVGYKETLTYDRIAYDGNGLNPILEARGHTYEVLAVNESVSVPAGTFDCVKVERVRTLGAESGALVWFWYAPGIGKIREERPLEMEIEELVSVTIPGGATYP
jgi:hypothetical protein